MALQSVPRTAFAIPRTITDDIWAEISAQDCLFYTKDHRRRHMELQSVIRNAIVIPSNGPGYAGKVLDPGLSYTQDH